MDEKIMDVAEDVETMAEPVAEIAKEVDWSKYGIIGVGIGVIAAGAFAAYKLGPKVIERGKRFKTERNVRKQAKQDGEFIKVDKYEVNDSENDEN